MDAVIDKNKKYLIAVSGGIDSMVLLDILIKEKYNLIVIHFNHHTRGEEHNHDLELIENYCSINNLELLIEHYYHNQGNFQSKAREFRLKKYKEQLNEHNLEAVFLAHHADDQIENILMNQTKIGNVLMKEKTLIKDIWVIRPLLETYKEQIKLYATNHDIKYNEDSSNLNDLYKRNQVRNSNNYTTTQKNVMLEVQQNQEKFYDQTKGELEASITKEKYLSFGDDFLLLYLFLKNYIDLNVSQKLISDLVNSIDFKGTKSFSLPNDFKLIQEYDVLTITKDSEEQMKNTQVLIIGTNAFNGIYFENNLELGRIRCRETGDKIIFKNGSKKVTRIMIDMKIPKNLRKIWPVVVNLENQPLYIPNKIKK